MKTATKAKLFFGFVIAVSLFIAFTQWRGEMTNWGLNQPQGRTRSDEDSRLVEVDLRWNPTREMKIDWQVAGGPPLWEWHTGKGWYKSWHLKKGARVEVGLNETQAFTSGAWKSCTIKVNGGVAFESLEDTAIPLGCGVTVK